MAKITKEQAIANRFTIHIGFTEGKQGTCYLYHEIDGDRSTGEWADSTNHEHTEKVLLNRDFSEFNSKPFTVTAYCFYSPCVSCVPKLNDLLDKYVNMTLEFKFSFIYGNYDLKHNDKCDDNLQKTLREDGRFKLSVITPKTLKKIKNMLNMEIEFVRESESYNDSVKYLDEVLRNNDSN